MSGGDRSGMLRDIGTLFNDGILGSLTDRQLLDRFINRNDRSAEDAFTIIVERHGPMVWGVCLRVLRDRDAATDAFQATFLVLVRKASAIRFGDSLGPWLYGVSRRVATRERATSMRRRARETCGVEAMAISGPDQAHAEQLAILDEEIGRLPEHQRATVVLCDLEGLPHEEAARRLGCPVGTVESRLSRGRRRLRDRLVRRGLAPAAATLWIGLTRDTSAAMPAALIKHTARFVTGSPGAGPVTALAQGVIQMMWLARLKPLAVVATTLVLATVTVQGRQQAGPPKAQEQAKSAPLPSRPDMDAIRALAKEQLALIDEALKTLHRLAQSGRTSFSNPSFSLWERRRLETLRKTGAGTAEIVAALEESLKNLKEDEAIARNLMNNARGTALDVYDVQFRRMETEIWLKEEKAR